MAGLGLAKDGGLAQVAGLLLVGHGTRDARGLAEYQAIARQVAELADGFSVEACYLELAEPSIATAMQRLLEAGVRRVTVAPLLLVSRGACQARYTGGGGGGGDARRKAEGGRRGAEGGSGRKEFGAGGMSWWSIM